MKTVGMITPENTLSMKPLKYEKYDNSRYENSKYDNYKC